jgi:hypothetical protein
MLCSVGEQSISDDETYFASRIFYPIVNDKVHEFSYNSRLSLSVIWRLLKQDFIPEEKDKSYLKILIEIKADYWDYLLGKKIAP